MAFDIKFADVVIDGIESWTESGPSRVNPQTFPRRHGAIVPKQSFLGPRTITVAGEILKDDEGTFKTYLDNLSATLTDKGQDKLTLRDDSRYINATKTAFSHSYQYDRTPGRAARFGIEFFCADPFWYSTTQQTSVNAGVTTGGNFTITNNGGAKTSPTIAISGVNGAGVYVQITNTTTGLNVKYTGDIAVGQVITFDHTNFRCLRAGGSALSGFTGTFWELITGAQNLRYDGSGTATIVVDWLERWA